MTAPAKKQKKAIQDNKKRKPTAQELHQKDRAKETPVNPTNVADPSTTAGAPPNTGAGYSAPDSPHEGDHPVDASTARRTFAGTHQAPHDAPFLNGDRPTEIPQPEAPPQTPVEDNPRM